MDNGFTGINIQQTGLEQERFYNIMFSVLDGINNDTISFFQSLRKNWASANAVTFAKNTATLVDAYLKNIGTYADRIIIDIFNSVDAYTRSTGDRGCNIIGDTNLENIGATIELYTLDATNEAGQSGMNIRLVEDLVNNELPKIKNNATSKIDTLPASISIYDANGDQQAAYSTRKQAIRDLVEELLTIIEAKIRSSIETERNNILLAKQQTVQNMNGSNTTNA